MNKKILSVVVPTKNRYTYLISFIKVCSTFNSDEFELVIQDNSDDNQEILTFLTNNNYAFIVYNHISSKLSMSENSDFGIKNSSGEYVCFMGDDDLLSPKLIDFVKYMKENNIESAVFNRASYNWPGVKSKFHKFPSLVIPNHSSKIKKLSVKREYGKLLKKGATSLLNMPQLYHGVIRRDALNKVYETCGTFFPGPSPDLAVSVALAFFVKNHVFADAPLISSGVSPKSSAGLGSNHMHKGKLSEVSFMPKNIEEIWDERIPKIWTGPTIYAESLFETLKALDKEKEIRYFNFSYFFAFFEMFNSDYKEMSKRYRKALKISSLSVFVCSVGVFLLRAKEFIKNIFRIKFKIGVKMFDNVPNTFEAEQIIDDNTKVINFKKTHI